MIKVPLQIVRTWGVRTPFAYRYMKKEYVEEFFQDGTLVISSFSAFSKHVDEQRNDMKEGWNTISHINREGNGQTVMMVASYGDNAHVLCGSMRYCEELKVDFSVDSGFMIRDTTAFGVAISSRIPNFLEGIEGPCSYLENKILLGDLGHKDFSTLTAKAGEPNLPEFEKMAAEIGGENVFFTKENKYAKQQEYRWVWVTSNAVDGQLTIKCPEARQYCLPFDEIPAHVKNKE